LVDDARGPEREVGNLLQQTDLQQRHRPHSRLRSMRGDASPRYLDHDRPTARVTTSTHGKPCPGGLADRREPTARRCIPVAAERRAASRDPSRHRWGRTSPTEILEIGAGILLCRPDDHAERDRRNTIGKHSYKVLVRRRHLHQCADQSVPPRPVITNNLIQGTPTRRGSTPTTPLRAPAGHLRRLQLAPIIVGTRSRRTARESGNCDQFGYGAAFGVQPRLHQDTKTAGTDTDNNAATTEPASPSAGCPYRPRDGASRATVDNNILTSRRQSTGRDRTDTTRANSTTTRHNNKRRSTGSVYFARPLNPGDVAEFVTTSSTRTRRRNGVAGGI